MADPTVTSVYQYYDRIGRILYVGVTARGVKRAQEHAETKSWWPRCTGCAIEHYETRDEALAREEELIKRYKPPFNTVHNDRKQEAMEAFLRNPVHRRIATEVSLTKRRREWYLLSEEEKKIAPCVRCGDRPGVRGPECVVCKPSRLLKTTSN